MDIEPASSGNFRIRLSKEAGAIYSPDIIYSDSKHNIVNDVTTENFDEKLKNGLYFESRGGTEPSVENELSELAKIYPNASICVYSVWYSEAEEEFIAQLDGFDDTKEIDDGGWSKTLGGFLYMASHGRRYNTYYHLN